MMGRPDIPNRSITMSSEWEGRIKEIHPHTSLVLQHYNQSPTRLLFDKHAAADAIDRNHWLRSRYPVPQALTT